MWNDLSQFERQASYDKYGPKICTRAAQAIMGFRCDSLREIAPSANWLRFLAECDRLLAVEKALAAEKVERDKALVAEAERRRFQEIEEAKPLYIIGRRTKNGTRRERVLRQASTAVYDAAGHKLYASATRLQSMPPWKSSA